MWRRDVVVITTAQLYSTKPELRLCASSNPARDVLEIRDALRAYEPMCLRAYVPCLPKCLRLLRGYVPCITTCRCLRAYVLFFRCLRAYILFGAYVLSCLELFSAHVHLFFTCLRTKSHSKIYWGSALYLVLLSFYGLFDFSFHSKPQNS